jgi:hypothetical protein
LPQEVQLRSLNGEMVLLAIATFYSAAFRLRYERLFDRSGGTVLLRIWLARAAALNLPAVQRALRVHWLLGGGRTFPV